MKTYVITVRATKDDEASTARGLRLLLKRLLRNYSLRCVNVNEESEIMSHTITITDNESGKTLHVIRCDSWEMNNTPQGVRICIDYPRANEETEVNLRRKHESPA